MTHSDCIVPVRLQLLHPKLGHPWPLPKPMTEDAAGFDLCAAIDESEVLVPGERKLVPCGFSMALPKGYEAQIRPRSGLAYKQGITCLNSPGTIDADYRGEVKVLLINHGQITFVIEPGMRIAQMLIAKLPKVSFEVVQNLEQTARGAGGFGSTGQ